MYRLLILIYFFSLFFSACNCEETPIPESRCEELNFPGLSNPEQVFAENLYFSPSCSPVNPDHLIFIRQIPKKKSQLVSFDLATLSLQTLYENSTISAADLSQTGWVAFTDQNQFLYKVKIDGDSLTQLTSKQSFGIDWHPDGRNILFSDYDKRLFTLDTYDSQAQPIEVDSIFSGADNCWLLDSSLIVAGSILSSRDGQESAVYRYFPSIQKATPFWKIPTVAFYGGEPHPNGKDLYWVGNLIDPEFEPKRDRIFKTHLPSGFTDTLFSYCQNDRRGDPTITADGKYIIYARQYKEKRDEQTIYYESNLYRLNLATLEEEIILIP